MNVQLHITPISLGILAVLGQIDCFTPTSKTISHFQPITNRHHHHGISKGQLASSKNDAMTPATTAVSTNEKNLFFCEEEVLSASTTTAVSQDLNASSLFQERVKVEDETSSSTGSFSYNEFAKQYPFVNNVAIATIKTGSADFMAQTVIGGTPLLQLDLERSFLFMLFGGLYSGCFQWVYQVQIFKRLFDVDKFTSLSWKEKLEDKEGLKQLIIQTGVDLAVLTLVYLPTFYIFKAGVFSGSTDPGVWVSSGIENYQHNFSKDEADALKVWFPADLVCFSVPLYLRLPVRHAVSFVWTAYLSFSRGGH